MVDYAVAICIAVVRDHIPLEQGLRHAGVHFVPRQGLIVRDHIPLEQGLRHGLSMAALVINTVRDHIPLEQGLRPEAGIESVHD